VEALEDRTLPAALPIDTTTILLANSAVDENQYAGALVGLFSPHLPGATGYTGIQLVAGGGDTGNAFFSVGGNQLRTKQSFNFEVQSSFSIRVKALSSNGVSSEENFTISIKNVNEAPVTPSIDNTAIDENSAGGTLVGTLSAADPDAGDSVKFSLTNSADGKFKINGSKIKVANGAVLDFEQQKSFYIRVRATDKAGLFTENSFVITLNNVNEAPDKLVLNGTTIQENSPTNQYVGWIDTRDPDGNPAPTLSLVNDAGGRFKINGTNLVVNDASKIDFESNTSHNVKIRATDAGGKFLDKTFTIKVTNANEAPTNINLSNAFIAMPAANGAVVGNLTASDPDAGATFQYILSNNAGGKFQITGNQLKITTSQSFKGDPQPSYDIKILVLDQFGQSFEKAFKITVDNAAQVPPNQAPDSIALNGNSIVENSPSGQYVGYVSAHDPDSFVAPILSLIDSADGRFRLDGSNLVVDDASKIDFEKGTSHNVTIRATDAGGKFLDKVFTINVVNQNEAPTGIDLSNAAIVLPAADGATVGTLSANDPDAGTIFTYILTNNAGGKFKITGNILQITSTDSFRYDVQPTYDVTVMVQDQLGLNFEKTFTISVDHPAAAAAAAANKAPNDITLSNNSIIENSPDGQFVAYVSAADPDSFDAPSLSLVDNAGGRFRFEGSNLVVNNPALLDIETTASHQITVRATDAKGDIYDETFTINVVNQNEAPTGIGLSNSFVILPAAGSLVGDLTATDPDAGTTLQFVLTNNAGGKFKLIGNQLHLSGAAAFTYDVHPTYDIKVLVLDQAGLGFEKTFTITVTDLTPPPVNLAPNSITISKNSIAENGANGNYVAYIAATDPDSYVEPVLTLIDDAGGRFIIVGHDLLVNDPALIDFEANASHQVTIRATAAGGKFFDKVFTINVTDVNEKPTDISLSNNSIAWGFNAGAQVGTLSATDPDAFATFQFVLTNNSSGRFTLSGNKLLVSAPSNFIWDLQTSYTIRVMVIDQFGQPFEKEFTINITGLV